MNNNCAERNIKSIDDNNEARILLFKSMIKKTILDYKKFNEKNKEDRIIYNGNNDSDKRHINNCKSFNEFGRLEDQQNYHYYYENCPP